MGDGIQPMSLGMTKDGDVVRGRFPIAVVRELHSIRQGSSANSQFIAEALQQVDAERALPEQSYKRCMSLLSLATLVRYGLSGDAPERYGLRRVQAGKSEKFQGSMDAGIVEEIRRLAWVGDLAQDDEDFLKKIVQRASKHG